MLPRQFRAAGFAWVTNLTALVLFALSSFRCDTFQFKSSIQFGLWYITEDESCRYWNTDDVWVKRGRVASVLAILFGSVLLVYLSLLLVSSSCSSRRVALSASLGHLRILGGAIAIGMVGIVSLASTIVRADLCQDQCIVNFSGLYCSAILWVSTGFSLLLVPLCTSGQDADDHKDRWKSTSNSATSNEDGGETTTEPEDGGFAIVKTFNNGETHITETIHEKDGTIRRTHIVKAADGKERVSARVYDDETPFSPEEDASAYDKEHQIADNEEVMNILLSDCPENARPLSTSIHWGSPKTFNEAKPVTYFQEPQMEMEPPAPFAVVSLSPSTVSQETEEVFPCQMPEILRDDVNSFRCQAPHILEHDNDDDDTEDDHSGKGSIPSTILFSKPPGDDSTASTYGPRLKPIIRQDVV